MTEPTNDMTMQSIPEDIVIGEGFAEKRPLDILEKQIEQPKVPKAPELGIPSIITIEMRGELLAYGLNLVQINAMSPLEAWKFLKTENDKNFKGSLLDTPLAGATKPTDLNLEQVHPAQMAQKKVETIVPKVVQENSLDKYEVKKDIAEYTRVLMKDPKRKRILVDLKMGLDAANSREYVVQILTSHRDQGKISEKECKDMLALMDNMEDVPKVTNALDTLVQDSAGASAFLMAEEARLEAEARQANTV